MEFTVKTSNGLLVKTTRCPIRVDGKTMVSDVGAPQLGEHNEEIEQKYFHQKITLEK
jgi:crotonobetainyl-CoA:carnitine CoA-transferase CaiB-like acyl-CoA transferase